MIVHPVLAGGCGMAVPSERLTNRDLEARLDTDDRWIVERSGIKERRVAGPGESTSTLAIAAGAAAMKDAGLTPDDIEVLVVATATPDQPLPGASALVADGLGLTCGSFDLGAACAGFTYGVVVGTSILAAGGGAAALVIGADTFTRIVDPADRNTAVLFGDGAGAVSLIAGSPTGSTSRAGSAPGQGPGVLAWDLGSDGTGYSLLEVPAGGSRTPTTVESIAEGAHWIRMDGRELFRRAVRVMADSGAAALAKAGLSPADVHLFVPHQANVRIIHACASRLGIDAGRVAVNVDRYGNTSAASVPLALAEAAEAGRLADGDIVLLGGIGAGLTWASVVVRWGRP
ncbi:MAG TPA: beta-ketoacyl-ACP synthase 3 [Acidimicrobiales bacterium]